jgi:hypothetical protein
VRIFLDANVLFSASNAGSNIAGLVSWAATREAVVTSDLAVAEARKNLELKRSNWLPAFDVIASLEIVPSVLFPLPISVVTKDAPLLCAAIRSPCTLFVTGDKRDFGHLYGQKVQGVEIVSLLRLAEILAGG